MHTLARALVGLVVTAVPPTAPRTPDCGVCLAHSWTDAGEGGYGTALSRRTLEELRDQGVRTVSLTSFAWMSDVTDAEVSWIGPWSVTEGLPRLRREARAAVDLGLTVMIKPHIWIRGGQWRGGINAPAGGWPKWFASYSRFILPHAELAEEVGAEWLCLGVELTDAVVAEPAAFAQIIEDVRRVYHGKLTFGANWDRVERFPFWSALDAVGVQMFAPLLGSGEPTNLDAMAAGAERWLGRFTRVAAGVGKPLVLTEVGFTNLEGTAARPWVWPERGAQHATAAGDREQADAYRAILSTFGRSDRVAAIYWWKWFSNPATREDSPVGFSPRSRSAQQVLRSACRTE